MTAENLYTPGCIRTASGIYMNVFEPTPDMICIEDIAHALSHQCRFGGHLPRFYSVAQHSFLCSRLVGDTDPAEALAGLLHDAGEAYLMDMPSPIKRRLTNYKEIEDKLMMVIAQKFGFAYPLSAAVKKADEQMLQVEWEVLMLRRGSRDPREKIMVLFSPMIARKYFLTEFEKLYKPAADGNPV